MWDRIQRVTQPAAEALLLDEIKQQARIDAADDDAFLTRCVRAAREIVEGPDGAGIAIMAAQWRLRLDCFPCTIRIPMGPVLDIDAIAYVDPDGVSQTLAPASYQWVGEAYSARIAPAEGTYWPATAQRLGAVTVTFTAGFPGTQDNPVDRAMIPAHLLHAMLMLAAHWDANRETSVVGVVPSEIQHGFDAIMNMFRVGRVA
jgi:uncharacterized phiE125 gp8 family phage protein